MAAIITTHTPRNQAKPPRAAHGPVLHAPHLVRRPPPTDPCQGEQQDHQPDPAPHRDQRRT